MFLKFLSVLQLLRMQIYKSGGEEKRITRARRTKGVRRNKVSKKKKKIEDRVIETKTSAP